MQDYGARTVELVHPEPPKRRLYNWSLEYIAPLNLKKNSYVHCKSGEKKSVLKVSRGSMPCYSALFSDDQCTICTCWG